MDNVNPEMKMLNMDQKVMLEIKNTVKEMKDVFDELPSSLTQLRKESVNEDRTVNRTV